MQLIRMLVLVLAVACLGVAGVESMARPVASWRVEDLSGAYIGGGMRVQLKADGAGYSGEIHFNNQVFPLSARSQGPRLEGVFRSGEHQFPFTAEVTGTTLTLVSGGNTYRLEREALPPPLPPPVPPAPNPLGGTATPTGQPGAASPGAKPGLAGLASYGAVRENPKRDWLILIYMAADNNLERFAMSDLNEIEEGLPADGAVEVVVLVDRHKKFDSSDGDWADARVYRMVRDDSPEIRSEVLARPGELNMGDPDVLAAFTGAALRTFPAKRHAVILWNHGGGWSSLASDDDAPGVPGGHDALTIVTLRDGLERGIKQGGLAKFQIIGFDMCLMGQLETAVELEGLGEVMIASQELEDGDGWPYAAFLPIFGRQMVASRRLAQEIVHAFDDYYKKSPRGKNATLSALDLGMVGEVVRTLDALTGSLERNLERTWTDVSRGFFYSQNYGGPGDYSKGRHAVASIDVLDFFKRVRFALEGGADGAIKRLGGSEAVRRKAADTRNAALSGTGLPEFDASAVTPHRPPGSGPGLPATVPGPAAPAPEAGRVQGNAGQPFVAEAEFIAFRDAMDWFIISTRASQNRSLSNGVAIYAPLHGEMFNERYLETRFARTSGWARLVRATHDLQQRLATPPVIGACEVIDEGARRPTSQVRNLGGYSVRLAVDGKGILWTNAIQGARTPQGLYILKQFVLNDPYWLTKQRDLPADSAALSMPEYSDGRTELMHELQGLRFMVTDGRTNVVATMDRSDFHNQDIILVPAVVRHSQLGEMFGTLRFDAKSWTHAGVVLHLPQQDGSTSPAVTYRLPPETEIQLLFRVLADDGTISYAPSERLAWGEGLSLVLGMDDAREYELALYSEAMGGKVSNIARARYTVVHDPEIERAIAQAGRFSTDDLLGDWQLEAANEQPTVWQIHPVPEAPGALLAVVVRGEKQVGRIILEPDTRVLPTIRARWLSERGDEIAFFTFTALVGRAGDGSGFMVLKDANSALQIKARKVRGRAVAQGPAGGPQPQPGGVAREFRHSSGLVFSYPAAWNIIDAGETIQLAPATNDQMVFAVNVSHAGGATLTQETLQAADMAIRQNIPFLQLAAQPEVLQTAGGQGAVLRYAGNAQGTSFAGAAFITIQQGLSLVLFGLGEANAYAQHHQIAQAVFQTFRVEGGQHQLPQPQPPQQAQGRIDLTGIWRGDDGTLLAFDAQNWELYEDDELQDRGTYVFSGGTLSIRSSSTGMSFDFRVKAYTGGRFTVLDEDDDPVVYTKVR